MPDQPDDQPRLIMHAGGLPPPFRDIQVTVHPVGWRGVRHRHGFWQLVFNRAGLAEVNAGEAMRVGVGQTAVLPPRLPHEWRNAGETPLDLLNINILSRQPGFDELYKHLRGIGANPERPSILPALPQLFPLVGRILGEIEGGAYGYKCLAAALLTEMVTSALRGFRRRQKGRRAESETVARIEKARWYLETHYAEPLRLGDIARVLHVSPKHACELFTREAGVSPMRQLRQVRLEKAGVLLEDTALSVKEIAFAVGFRDQHYFSRLFTREVGCPPSRYRSRGRE